MMSDINITTMVAQLPYMQDVAHTQLTGPQAQQVFAAQMAQQALRAQNQQVQKVEAKQGSQAVSDEGNRKKQPPPKALAHRRVEAEEEPDAPASNASPWLGHLLNKKV